MRNAEGTILQFNDDNSHAVLCNLWAKDQLGTCDFHVGCDQSHCYGGFSQVVEAEVTLLTLKNLTMQCLHAGKSHAGIWALYGLDLSIKTTARNVMWNDRDLRSWGLKSDVASPISGWV